MESGVLRNWILGVTAVSLWVVNYLVYFARDIWGRDAERRRQGDVWEAGPPVPRPSRPPVHPLPEPPPPPPPPQHEAEIIPFPHRYPGQRRSGDRTEPDAG
jgi:hypothetical protein